MLTRRKEIIELLKLKPHTVHELALYFETNKREILEDLKHVQRSMRGKLYVESPICLSCGKTIKINKVRDISKCPYCRSTHLSKARFFIKL